MPLKAIVENLDDIPEALREFYEEKDGKFALVLDGDVQNHPLVSALKNAHERQKQETKKAKDALKALQDSLPDGFSAEEWDRLKALEANPPDPNDPDEAKKRKDAAAMFEQRIAAQAKKHETEIAEKDKVIGQRDEQIRKLIIDSALDAAMDAALIDAPHRKAVRALIRGDVKVVEEGGELRAVVETSLDPETPLAKYVGDWAQSDEGRIYVSKAKGSDATGGGRQLPNEVNPWSEKSWNLTQQGQIIRTDREKAKRLAAAAGKSIPGA